MTDKITTDNDYQVIFFVGIVCFVLFIGIVGFLGITSYNAELPKAEQARKQSEYYAKQHYEKQLRKQQQAEYKAKMKEMRENVEHEAFCRARIGKIKADLKDSLKAGLSHVQIENLDCKELEPFLNNLKNKGYQIEQTKEQILIKW